MKKTFFLSVFALAAMFVSSAAFSQTSTFNPENGTGFAAKGDVQTVLVLNNAGLQALGTPAFTYVGSVETEYEWTCTNSNTNVPEQVRTRTTTVSVQGVVAGVARIKNQITGYNLNGYIGDPTITVKSGGGPELNSCPGGDKWSLTSPAGPGEVVGSTGGLFVNGVSLPTI